MSPVVSIECLSPEHLVKDEPWCLYRVLNPEHLVKDESWCLYRVLNPEHLVKDESWCLYCVKTLNTWSRISPGVCIVLKP